MSAPARTNGRAPRVVTPAPEPEQVEGSQLAAAVLRVQAAAPKLIPNEDGQVDSRTYRYVTNDALVDAILPLLVTEELLWRAFPTFTEDGRPGLRYRMTHVPSGEADEDVMPLCGVTDSQSLGSAITYDRRYALVAYLNLTVDPDDDGRGASNQPPVDRYAEAEAAHAAQPTATAPKSSERPASAKQRGMLNGKAADAGLTNSQFADLIKEVAGQEILPWTDDEAAGRWLGRAMDRLPASHVTALKNAIEAAES